MCSSDLRLSGWCRLRRGMRARGLAQLLEQRWIDVARVEDRLESPRGQLMDLRCREVDAVTLRDPCADVAHDLLNIDMFAAGRLWFLTVRRTAIVPTTTPAPAVVTSPSPEMAASAALALSRPLLIVIHCHFSIA